MKIINIHKREYNRASNTLSELLDTLSSDNDRLWPREIWPPMILSDGLKTNSAGGHGPIRYCVTSYEQGRAVEFKFTKPKEYRGIHKFEINEITASKTELKHTINMDLNLKGIVTWYFAFKWLHDALLEDCLDKVHNQLEISIAKSEHNIWVKILRNILKRK